MAVEIKNEQPIAELFAYLSIDKDGNEGICAYGLGGMPTFPLVCGYERIAKQVLRPVAQRVAKETGATIKLVKFTAREDIETIT